MYVVQFSTHDKCKRIVSFISDIEFITLLQVARNYDEQMHDLIDWIADFVYDNQTLVANEIGPNQLLGQVTSY